MAIPVIDFNVILRHLQGEGEDSGPLRMLHQAFSTVGFVYLSNHGIDEGLVSSDAQTAARLIIIFLEV